MLEGNNFSTIFFSLQLCFSKGIAVKPKPDIWLVDLRPKSLVPFTVSREVGHARFAEKLQLN